MAAEEEPSPRDWGMRLAQTTSSPGGCPHPVEGGPQRAYDEVPLVARQLGHPLARDVERQPGRGHAYGHLVVELEGHAGAVEPGAEVGAGGGDAYAHRCGTKGRH